jgi:hypothetical protein
VVAGRDPGDVRAVCGEEGIEGGGGIAPLSDARRKCASGDHLAARVVGVSLRVSRRGMEASRAEEGMAVIDTVVEDRNLHSAPRRAEVRSPEGRSSDRAGALAK